MITVYLFTHSFFHDNASQNKNLFKRLAPYNRVWQEIKNWEILAKPVRFVNETFIFLQPNDTFIYYARRVKLPAAVFPEVKNTKNNKNVL